MMVSFVRKMTPYNPGERAEFPDGEAQRIITEGFAAPVRGVMEAPPIAKGEDPPQEKAEKGSRRSK